MMRYDATFKSHNQMMLYKLASVGILLFLLINTSPAQSVRNNPITKKQVLILGTYHFASNADRIKVKLDDMLGEKRQKEIEALVANLATYKPDKICIEWKAGTDQQIADSLYNAFINGTSKVRANEIYQIAFRLAKKLGHKKVFCIDAPSKFLYDTLVSTALKYNQKKGFELHAAEMTRKGKMQDSLRKLNTLKDNLRILNSKSGVEFGLDVNDVFLSPQLGVPGEYAGAEFLAEWYKRNIRMYSNIVRTCEADDKRIFVLVGASHKSILNQFFQSDPKWELVDSEVYLK